MHKYPDCGKKPSKFGIVISSLRIRFKAELNLNYMAFQAQEKTDIVTKFAINEGDTGSTRVQVALITERLKYLLDHFKMHPKDHHSRRGLLKMVGRRKRLLEYLKKQDIQGYRDLIQELGIRK